MRTIIKKKILHVLESNKFRFSNNLDIWLDTHDLHISIQRIKQMLSIIPKGPIGIVCSDRIVFLSLVIAATLDDRGIVLFGDKWTPAELEGHFQKSPCCALISDKPFKACRMMDPHDPIYVLEKDQLHTASSGSWIGQYTSGTTGRSRLVIRDWEAVSEEISALQQSMAVCEGAIFLNMTPLHHSYGFCGGMMWPFFQQYRVFLIQSFYPSYARKIWSVLEPDVVYGIPYQYHFIADAPGPDITQPQYAFSAGAPLTRDVRQLVQDKLSLKLTNNYGSTETGTLAIYPNMTPETNNHVVGWPLQGRTFSTDEKKQLHVCSKGNMKGYYDGLEQDGPFATGDFGEIREDGCVVVLGRIKPVITIGGIKVSIEKVENVLKSIQGVKDVVVIPESAEGFYELIKAFIVLEEPSIHITDKYIKEYCKLNLQPVEIPRRLIFLDKLPTSDTGKIQGKYLVEM
ncbi:class I adenylate-forming enzyme family protein [Paenibacillus agilis]|uniref:Long-chain fatty acid--CoA ligase n=1 Tax=Paenibacillus agilis TaxID=3020863 RepID=A0A559J141_9BACL|nr:fatty acid--CoA ligase family protein [Paenibacillus agilis]TVX93561.1 long-chain fatty acid--CoA ligase [Paenibacillus agilis]